MKLEIECVDIKDIKVGTRTHVDDHILYINLSELENLILKDERLASVELNLVHPGDRVRIININDVIQPRCKIDRHNEDFPGWLGKLKTAGEGRTRSLRGISVLISNPLSKRAHSAILDMTGIGAEISKYGIMRHISVAPFGVNGTEERDLENAIKLAGLKTAVYLARAAEGHMIDETEVYDLDVPHLTHKRKDLPRVAYYCQLYTPQRDYYKGLPDPIFYGTGVSTLLPTIIHPNEILDGGIVNPHTLFSGRDTYTTQNHAVIKELYKRHEKELLFAGVVIGVANMDPIQRERKAMMAANLFSNVLGADGVILSKYLGGMTQVDLGLVAEECERLGMKTTLFIEMSHGGGSLDEQMIHISDSLNAGVNIGQILELVSLPLEADRILGGSSDTPIFPDPDQKAGDNIVRAAVPLIAGVYDNFGGAKLIAAEY